MEISPTHDIPGSIGGDNVTRILINLPEPLGSPLREKRV
jgi:hypothetical protein